MSTFPSLLSPSSPRFYRESLSDHASSKQLYFTNGETIPGDDREQSILVSGNPQPTVQNIQWFLNGTIPLSTLSQFTVLDYALSLPPVIRYEHSGNYTIVVNTSAGSVRDSFVITVIGK